MGYFTGETYGASVFKYQKTTKEKALTEAKKSLEAAAQHLLDTACDLEIKQGFSVQWFAVRLDPPEV